VKLAALMLSEVNSAPKAGSGAKAISPRTTIHLFICAQPAVFARVLNGTRDNKAFRIAGFQRAAKICGTPGRQR
jgi:hypothetical protein